MTKTIELSHGEYGDSETYAARDRFGEPMRVFFRRLRGDDKYHVAMMEDGAPANPDGEYEEFTTLEACEAWLSEYGVEDDDEFRTDELIPTIEIHDVCKSDTVDTAGAIDADVSAGGKRGNITLIPRESDGELDTWGEGLDHWAESQLHSLPLGVLWEIAAQAAATAMAVEELRDWVAVAQG